MPVARGVPPRFQRPTRPDAQGRDLAGCHADTSVGDADRAAEPRTPAVSGGGRVTRIFGVIPVGGVWLGILAYDARMPRDQMMLILEAAQDSIRPMPQ